MSARQAETTSIVITTYNRADLVGRAIESGLAQAGACEVIVVDDGSTDATAGVLAGFGDRITVVSQANGGLSAARNAGAAVATGTWLGFLDDDDRLLPGWLDHLTHAATAGGDGTATVCCAARYVDPDGALLHVTRPRPLGPAFGNRTALFLAGSFIVLRTAFLHVGGYAVGLRCSHQTELGLRLTQHFDDAGLGIACVDEPLVEVTGRPATARPMSSPTALFEGALMVIDRHRARLALDPPQLADFYSVAGVSAARLGRYPEARRLLRLAARTQPRRLQRWARLGIAVVPALGRRVWRSDQFEGPPRMRRAQDRSLGPGEQPTVLHVTWRLSRTGGIPIVVRALVRELAGRSHTHVATVRPVIKEDGLDELAGSATFHPLGLVGNIRPQDRALLAARLFRLARAVRPDVVHAHSGIAVLAVAAAFGAPGARRVLDVHDAPGNGRHGRMTEWLEGFLCRRVGFVPVVHSSSVREQVRERWRVAAARIELVPLGIETSRFSRTGIQRAIWREANGLSPERPLVLYVTRLAPSKNVDLLLDAALILERRSEAPPPGRDPMFAVVGDGTQRQELERRIGRDGLSDRVRLTGPKTGDDLVAAYAAADVFVSTSDYEGFGLVVVEAMSAGLPVVACAAGGVTDLVAHGSTGYLVAPGDAGAVAAQLAGLLDDDALRREMGAAGAARASKLFDAATMADGYLAVYCGGQRAHSAGVQPASVALLKSGDYAGYLRSHEPALALPYRIDELERHGLSVRWTDAHLRPPWTLRPLANVVRMVERAAAPCLQTLLMLPTIARSDAVLALFESEGNLLAFARRAPLPPLRRPGLVVVSCWLADLLVRGDESYRHRYRTSYRHVDRLVYFSSNQTAIFADHLGLDRERLRFVPFGIDEARYAPVDVPDDGAYVLAVGRDAARDWATFFEAMRRCGLPARVLCRPSQIRDLRVPDNVEILGYTAEPTYRALLAGARVSVVATTTRAYPSGQSVVLESMAMARATVVTDTPALRDYLRPGRTALAVPPGDAEALADAISTAFEDRELRSRLGGEARATVEQEFTAARMWGAIAAVIHEVAR